MDNGNRVSDFSSKYISMMRIGRKYTLTNSFKLDEPCYYSWYIYNCDNKNETIDRFNNLESNVLVYEAKTPDLLIDVKAFICDKDGNKASAWADKDSYETKPEFMQMSDLDKETVNNLVIWEYFQDCKKQADDLIKGEYKGYSFSLPIDWRLPEIDSRTVYGEFYSYRGFGAVLQCAWDLGDSPDNQYLDFLFDITRTFLDMFRKMPNKYDDRAWNDDHVARRTIIWCNMYLLWRDRMDLELRQAIECGLWRNAELLSLNWFYKKRHNHGMFQDQALAMYSIMFKDSDPKSEYYLNLSQKRVSEFFDYVISEDGVSKEHSPQYYMVVACQMGWFEKNFRALEAFKQFSDHLAFQLKKTLKFAVYITKPDGNMAEIGDSKREFYKNRFWNDNYLYQYVLSKGSEGVPPLELSAFFPKGGYAIMRSSWPESFGDATWMLLSAATHSVTHKHNDDLSFLLYHRGELITEAGQRNYDYKDIRTHYTYTSYAHNVLFIDGEAWPVGLANGATPILEEKDYRTAIVDYGDNGEIAWASAESYRWEKVKQTRTITYNRENQTVIVKDLLEANQRVQARLIYHIADGVDVKQTNKGWKCYRDGDSVAEIRAVGNSSLKLSTLRGEGKPPFRTWIFKGLEPSEGSLLVLDFTCEIGENIVALEINLFAAGWKISRLFRCMLKKFAFKTKNTR